MAEDYGKLEEGLESYSVALIQSNLSDGATMNSLKDRKSCHPAAGDAVGWTAPVGLLIGRGVIQWDGCNPYQSSGEYFDQSCVPGLWFIRVVKTYVLVPLVSEMCFLFEDLVNSLCIEKNNNLEINSY